MKQSLRHEEESTYIARLLYSKSDPSFGLKETRFDFAKQDKLDLFLGASFFRHQLGAVLRDLKSGNLPDEVLPDVELTSGQTYYLETIIYYILTHESPEVIQAKDVNYFMIILEYMQRYDLTIEFGRDFPVSKVIPVEADDKANLDGVANSTIYGK